MHSPVILINQQYQNSHKDGIKVLRQMLRFHKCIWSIRNILKYLFNFLMVGIILDILFVKFKFIKWRQQ
ncbi:MAG TPA: hypothetical protein DEF04_03290 [Clostridiales bacterium]|nr:hypothetical protein [Clostridiales bacterium]